MGSTSSKSKRAKSLTLVHDQSTQTVNALSFMKNELSYRHQHRSSFRDHLPEQSPVLVRQKTDNRYSSPPRTILSDCHEHQRLKRVESLETVHSTESLTRQRSTSIPIDMFLIDISNECVPVGQPVSLNIRHLILPASDRTTAAHHYENLHHYISDVSEQYPNETISSNQSTRKVLHTRLSS